jgi:hypothetical protein
MSPNRALVLSLAGATLLLAQEPGKPGSRLETITAQDLSGNAVRIPTAGRVTAIVFISTQCPISNSYNERMEALYKEYSTKGIQFVFLNANANEAAGEIDQHAREHGFSFKVLRDEGAVMADALGAQFTPETYVIDQQGVIRYHGRIDDARNVARVTVRNLSAALDAVQGGRTVDPADAKAFGCSIKRAKKST